MNIVYAVRFTLCHHKACGDCALFEQYGYCDEKIKRNLRNNPKEFLPYVRKNFKRVFPRYPKVSEAGMKEIADITITLFNWAE